MTDFKVFSSQSGSFQAVKQGWSWPAFLFSFWWALVKKMYVLSALIIALNIAVYWTLRTVDLNLNIWLNNGTILCLFNLGFCVFLGIFGNRWRESSLLDKGFKHQSTHKASDDQDAISIYYMSRER